MDTYTANPHHHDIEPTARRQRVVDARAKEKESAEGELAATVARAEELGGLLSRYVTMCVDGLFVFIRVCVCLGGGWGMTGSGCVMVGRAEELGGLLSRWVLLGFGWPLEACV